MYLNFTKIHGTGNDFILVDDYKRKYNIWNSRFVRQICEFHTGIGADGFLVLENDNQYDFRMRFFNSDGFESDMCVNGSRCICYFAQTLGYVNQEMCFVANDGTHKAKVKNEEVEVQVNYKEDTGDRAFPDEYILPEDVRYKSFINTGVPHIILETENIEEVNVDKIGRELRYHQYYQPEGTNVNFVKKLENKNSLRIRTYERGVESETLSCGTGATAAALIYAKANSTKNGSCKLVTNGGILTVKYSKNFKEIYLKGPVKKVFEGRYSLEEEL